MDNKVFIAALFLLVAGAANGFMDSLQFHYSQTGFNEISTFWNPALSWRNKYAICEGGALCQPLQSRFWGSTTVFSFLTDAWHLIKFIYLNATRIAVLFLMIWAAGLEKIRIIECAIIFVVLALLHAAGFHLVYSLIF